MRRRLAGRWVRAALCVTLLLASAALTIAWVTPAAAAPAKTSKPSTPSLSARVAEQKKQIDALQAILNQQQMLFGSQRALADSQAVHIGAQQKTIAELEAQLRDMKTRLEILESQANLPAWEDSLDKRIRMVEAATQKAPELPPDIVSAGDFPGSIRIPGSDAAIKFGGRIRTAVVLTLDPLGTDDRFLTNSIPVDEPPVSGEARRTNISARASRLNIEFRTPGGTEEVRAFFEGDFAGEGNAFRLRHAYAQYRGFIVGQTWSTFSDPWVYPEDLDFEGISSDNIIRQPQVRYWWGPNENTRYAVAIETPAVSITGGLGVNLFPDAIARGFWGRTPGAHTQVAGVIRQIRGEAFGGGVSSDWGFGASVTGVVLIPIDKATDRFMYQVNGGRGVARYINDLNSAGGLDAVFDTTDGSLNALPALGWYLAYEHKWHVWDLSEAMNLRSTVLWSRVEVDNFDFMPPDSYRKTNRLATNLVFSPNGRADIGLEYIFGSRTNQNGHRAQANQFQLVALVRF